jgi:AraC-like DNA-binding protein
MLDTPWDAADAGLLRMLLSRADATLQAQGRSSALVDHVLAAVAAQGYGRATIDAVAGSLDMSARTLQRRLAESQTSLRQLVEAARMDEALLLLADSRQPLSMLAERLGYAEPSAFSHAVRGYWGKPPRELRDELARKGQQAGAETRMSAAQTGKHRGG